MQYCSSDSKCKEVQLLVQHRRGMAAVALKGTFFFSVSSVLVPSSFSCYAARFGGYSLSSSMLANYFLIRIFSGSIEYMVYHPDRLLYGGRNRERVLGLFSVEARRHSSKSDHVMWKEESGGERAREPDSNKHGCLLLSLLGAGIFTSWKTMKVFKTRMKFSGETLI